LFVADVALKGSHYMKDIISGVGHPRSDSVMLLVFYVVMCNGWGTSIVL
jgi:hypothetical protein